MNGFTLDRGWVIVPAVVFAAGTLMLLDDATNTAVFINLHRSVWEWPSWIKQSLTFMGDAAPALVVALLFARRRPDIVWAAILAAVIGTLYTHTLKPLFDAPRPPAVLDGDVLYVVGHMLKRHSFPSGHALTAFTLAGVLLFATRDWRLRAALFAGAVFVGFSRVFVGVHWPVDVMAGAFGGWVAASLGVYWSGRWRWGMGLAGRRILVYLLMAVAVYLLFYDGGYPQARWLGLLLAVSGLVTGWHALRDLRAEARRSPRS